ncbi:MAG: efflux RND transporter periplasmic adaptor subunit [Betaproteobacteria bacterium]
MKVRGVVLALLCLAALAACSDSNGKKKPEPPPVPVTTATATENDVPVTLQVVGRAEAYESVTLKARIDGQVSAVLFTEGQHVNQGDVLIRLDPTDFAARLQQAVATTARDEALMTKSRHDTARYSALKGRNFVSEEKVNDVRTSEATASANLRASKAAEQFARLQLSYTTIRAPFTGVVGARLVFPGSAIKVNDTTLAVVNRIRPLLISFSLPEKHLPRLRESMKSGHMKVSINLPGDTSQSFEGEVRFIDNAVDPATGTIILKATLPNDDEKLTSGQFLNVSLTLNTLTKAVTVPNEAVQQGSEGNFVFVVKEDSSVEMRKIEAIASNGGITAVKSGLQNGEIVVTDGHLRLAPGVKIKAKETSSPSNTSAPTAPSSTK